LAALGLLHNAAAGPWPVSQQPELKQAFERAPALQTESLGEPARGVNVWERWLVANPDGQSWDVLQIYFKEYYGPTWLCAVDLGTGEVKKQRLPDDHQFYLSGRALGFDGKYYIATPYAKTWSMALFVYDPATNTIEERGEIVPGLGGEVRPLVTGPDRRIYGTGDDYVGTFIFDPKTDQTIYSGPRTGLAPYTGIVCDGKLYQSGYPGGPLFVFDPAQPWTLGKGGPPGDAPPDRGDRRSNPRLIGEFYRSTRVGLMHSSALGADGRVYFGGFGLRHYTGGGFGWYDPKTRKLDGFWKPLSDYAVHWVTPALDGNVIVISTRRAADELNNNQAPPEARLLVFDVNAQMIAREMVPVAKARTTGLIAEVAPGRLLGLTSVPAQSDRSILYGVDVNTGETLFTKELPSPVSKDTSWPHWVDPSYEYHAFVRGPDGSVWTWLKDVLVRIDLQDASVHVVGKVNPVGWPTFVGRDLYLSGSEQLRRFRGIAPAP